MKKSTRQEHSIIIYFGFYFVLLIISIIFFFNFLYPSIQEVENLKTSVKSTYDNKIKIEKDGLSYSDFINLSKGDRFKSYQKELLNNIDAEFYTSLFKNDTQKSYINFLSDKKDEFNNSATNNDFEVKQEKIVKLLPTYSEVEIDGLEDPLSDFKFINYIENLLTTFNLSYSNDIGINNLFLVEEFNEEGRKSQLDTDLYYIPLNLTLEGTKLNIINFLYFIENVGNVYVSENELTLLTQNEDNFLKNSSQNRKIFLKSDVGNVDIDTYNIFENQVIDIKELSFNNYLDNQEFVRNKSTDGFINFVKNTQSSEEISVDVELNFYVKGVQNIKIINQLNMYIDFFKETQQLINIEIKNTDKNSIEILYLENSRDDLQEMSKTLGEVNLAISKQENLSKALKDITEYNKILYTIHNKIGYHVYIKSFLIEYNSLLLSADGEFKEYLESLEDNINALKQGETEDMQNYNTRINTKKNFQQVIQIKQNIELIK